jgi:hypothetical protein
MGYIGNRPTAVPLTSADIQDGVITAADLGANSVDSSELVDNSVTLAKMAGLARGKLIYGDASGDPAALAVGGADEVLTHDGTDFDWAAASGGTNTPAFRAIRESSNQTISNVTVTKIQFNGEDFDTDSAFDSTTNYRFTVPAGAAGKYFFNMRVHINSFSGGTGAGYYIQPRIYKNGSVVQREQNYDFRSGTKSFYGNVNVFLDLSATDYIEGYIYNSSADSASKDIDDYLGFSCLEGFKVTT